MRAGNARPYKGATENTNRNELKLRHKLKLRQYRIILSADAASEKYKLLSKKRR